MVHGRFFQVKDGEEANDVSIRLPLRSRQFTLVLDNIRGLDRMLKIGMNQIIQRCEEVHLSGSQFVLNEVLSVTLEIAALAAAVSTSPRTRV